MFRPRIEGLEDRIVLSYFFTDIGTSRGFSDSYATGINAKGQVVGYESNISTGLQHAFLWDSAHGMQDLGALPGGAISKATGIDDQGRVFGSSAFQEGSSETHAFVYSDGQMHDLGALGGVSSRVNGVSRQGKAAGDLNRFTDTGLESDAFIYADGQPQVLGTLGGISTQALGINDQGQVVGRFNPTMPEVHAYLYSGGKPIDLGTLGGNYSVAYGVNELGQVVGESFKAGAGGEDAFLWDGAHGMQDLGNLGVPDSHAYGINNQGQVVGYSITAHGEYHPFLWDSVHGMQDLGTLPGGSITIAHAINDQGDIAGEAYVQGHYHAFIAATNRMIQAVVHDVVLDFPNRTSVLVNRPLAGATVSLLSAAGDRVLATSTSDAQGKFALDEPTKPGIYLLDVSKTVARYDHAANRLVPDGWTIDERFIVLIDDNLEVTIRIEGKDVPQDQAELLLPASLVDRESRLIERLNKLTVPPNFGGVVNGLLDAQGQPLTFRYDTREVENVLARAVSESRDHPFEGVYSDHAAGASPGSHLTGTPDLYNANIRLTAMMALLNDRFDYDIRLADQFAKTASAYISVQAIQVIGKKYFPDSAQPAQYLLRALKIHTLGEEIGDQLPKYLDALQRAFPSLNLGDPGLRNAVIEFVYKSTRFSLDLFTGQVKDDAIFEVIFNTLRTALFTAYIEAGLKGIGVQGKGVLGSENVLRSAAVQGELGFVSGDTNETLNLIERLYTGNLQFTNYILNTGKDAQRFISAIGLGSGDVAQFLKAAKAVDLRGLKNPGVTAGVKKAIGSRLDAFSGTLTDLKVLQTRLATGPYLIAVGLPVIDLIAIRDIAIRDLQRFTISGPSGGAPAIKVASPTASHVRTVPAVESSPRIEAASVPSDPAFAAYLGVLGKIGRAVAANDVTSSKALIDQLINRHDALFTKTVGPLADRAEAALQNIPAGSRQAAVLSDFLLARPRAEDAAAFLGLELDLWGLAPTRASQVVAGREVTKVLTSANQEVVALSKAAAAASSALRGVRLGGALVVDVSNVPASVTGVKPFSLTFLVKNVGGRATAAGTVVLTTATDLKLTSTATRQLRSLAPGQSAQFTWRVVAARKHQARDESYQFEARPGSGGPGIVDDFLFVSA